MESLGTYHHIGIAVKDLNRGIANYRELFGIGEVAITQATYQAEWLGRREDVSTRVAFAHWGGILLELIEGGATSNPANDWIKKHGEGIYHLGYPADPGESGIDAVQCFKVLDHPLEDGSPYAVYLDTVDQLGYYVELIEPRRAIALSRWIDRNLRPIG
jgi:methylmalonyl-CoA/ethylmalonyl-CoA epimerase